MDELSPLFQDIKFNVTFRGYDPDDVDAYVDRVAKAAASVQGRIAELQQRAAAAEANLASVASMETEATLTRTLVLAQKTADAAIAEAQAEGQVKRREADDYASRVLAEAETDRRRIVAQAESAVVKKAVEERNRVAKEVLELEQCRRLLSDDVEILERFLADQRGALSESLSSLTRLIEKPGAFRTAVAPTTSGAELDIATFTEGAVVAAVSVAEPAEPVLAELTVEPADLPADLPPPAHSATTPPSNEATGPVVQFAGQATVEVAVIPDPEPPINSPQSRWSADNSVASPDPQSATAPLQIVTAADLEKGSTEPKQEAVHDAAVTDDSPDDVLLFEEPEPATSDDPFLDQLRDAASSEDRGDLGDEALAEFFDHVEADGGRTWFNRRR